MNPVAQAFWLSATTIAAGTLHMVAVRRDWLAGLARPLDGGVRLGGQALFGPNKTWRGLLFMALVPVPMGALQGLAWGAAAEAAGLAPIDLLALGRWLGAPAGGAAWAAGYALLAFVLGLGYALGELPNSFLKRRLAIEPGKTGAGLLGGLFFLLDQADSVIAALGLAALLLGLPLEVWLWGTLALSGFHLLMNGLLKLGKVRKNL